MKALVIAEHADIAAQLCAGCRTLADEVAVALVGGASYVAGSADAAYTLAVPAGCAADDAAASLKPAADGAQIVVAEPTRRMKSVIGHMAAAAGSAVITDAMSFVDGAATSMYYGGVGQVTRKAAGEVAFYTASPSAFGEAGEPSGSCAEASALEWVAPAKAVRVVSSEPVTKTGVDLTKSDVVVAAGRGFAEEADLELARTLCDKIGAGLGCTRPLAEGNGWMPTETYIGVSGLMLSPKVYVAAGVSGQMQHMVGANRSGLIFAINKDENAPVFKQCDYGLVGDIKDVLPALNALL